VHGPCDMDECTVLQKYKVMFDLYTYLFAKVADSCNASVYIIEVCVLRPRHLECACTMARINWCNKAEIKVQLNEWFCLYYKVECAFYETMHHTPYSNN
jgi:hypothetical protein